MSTAHSKISFGLNSQLMTLLTAAGVALARFLFVGRPHRSRSNPKTNNCLMPGSRLFMSWTAGHVEDCLKSKRERTRLEIFGSAAALGVLVAAATASAETIAVSCKGEDSGKPYDLAFVYEGGDSGTLKVTGS